eukprot:g3039.t1
MAAVQSRSLLSEVDPYDASPDVPFTLERAKEILNDAGASAILQILYQLQHPQAEKLILQQEVTLQKLWLVAVENLAAHGWVPVVEATENVVGTQRPRGVRRAKDEPSIDLPVTTTYFHNASKNETLDLLDIHLENETWETYLLHCLPMLTRAKWFGGKMRWPVEVVAFTTLHEREQEEGSTSIKSKVAILDTLMKEEDEDDSYVVVRSMVRGGVWRGIDKELSRSARETETTPGPGAELGEMDMSKLPGEAPQDSWLTSTLVGLTALNIRRSLGGRDRTTQSGARVLFVGLGCGHLVSAIARYFYRDHSRMASAGAEDLRLDVLEPDTEVVAGAEEFFGFVKAGGVQADAARERASRSYTGPGSVPAFSSADADRSSQVVRKRKKKASNLRELSDVIPARVVNTAEEVEDCVYDIIVVDGVVALEKLIMSQNDVESSPSDVLCSWLERRLRTETGTVIVSGQRNTNARRTTFGANATSLPQLFRNSNGTWQTVGEFTLRAGAAADAKEQASIEDVVGVGSFRHKMELSLAEWSEVVVEQEDALVYNSRNDGAESSSSSTAARADTQPFELPTLREAQRSEVLHMKNVLSSSEIDQIGAFVNLCADQRIGSEVRSHDEKTAKAWKVLFLQQELRFQKAFPDLCARLKRRVVETIRTSQKEKGTESCWTRLLDQCRSDSDRSSDIDGKVEHEDFVPGVTLNMRVIEYHRQVAPSPGLPDPWHYDQDSIFTLDILLSEAEGMAFEGGQFKTLEYDGNLQEHRFGKQGDAVLFVSHKHHCVQPVTKGERRVLVIEFWPWAERSCGHRCEVAARRACPMEKGKIASSAEAVKSLSTPRNTANTEHAEPQTESKQCTAADTKEAFRMEGGVDVSACLPLPMRLGNVVVSSVGELDEEDNAGVTHRILWQGNEVQAGQIQAVPEKMDTKDDAWDLFD